MEGRSFLPQQSSPCPHPGLQLLGAWAQRQLLFTQPSKHLCLFEFVVQNISADYSAPPGALEEADIMQNY